MRKTMKADVTLVLNKDGSAMLEFQQVRESGYRESKRHFACAHITDERSVRTLAAAFNVLETHHV